MKEKLKNISALRPELAGGRQGGGRKDINKIIFKMY